MRDIRFVAPGTVYEITDRTNGGEFLFKPSTDLADIIKGCIGRALARHPVRLIAFVFLSNHYHMLISADDARQLAQFLGFVNGNIAREVNRFHDRTGHVWGRRFRAIPVSDEEAAQVGRLRYLLAHGVKEGIVRRVRDWTGASSARALLGEDELAGTWYDRAAAYAAGRRKTNAHEPREFATRCAIALAPLPCWQHLSADQYRARVAALVADIDSDGADGTRCDATHDLAPAEVPRLKVDVDALPDRPDRHGDPPERPKHIKRSPAPRVHAASKEVRDQMCEALRELRQAYAEASLRFRSGEYDVAFPAGTFRPAGGFVPLGA